MCDYDQLLTVWMLECPGAPVECERKILAAPGTRTVKVFAIKASSTTPLPNKTTCHAAAYVGGVCYAVAGGADIAEAKRWLVYRLGLASDPNADSAPSEQPEKCTRCGGGGLSSDPSTFGVGTTDL